MVDSDKFLKSILDTITDNIVVIDKKGDIQFVNSSWITFCQNNNCSIDNNWEGVNYLTVCDESAAIGDEYALKVREGIGKVINSEEKLFYLEYPCDSPDEKRWFMMMVTPFQLGDRSYYVIVHHNITERKLTEEKILNLSRIDDLTCIPNRRFFDEFLNSEWSRCTRLHLPITLAMIDIDHFKLLNDTYGHQTGDECLRKIGTVLKNFVRRPGDICARYGGEEFAIILSNTAIEKAVYLMNKLLDEIRELEIPNEKSPVKPILTVSIGLATMYPDSQTHEEELIKAADELLYSAKENGRNQLVFKSDR